MRADTAGWGRLRWMGGATGLVRLEPVERPGWTEPGAGRYGVGWKGGVAGLVRLEPVEIWLGWTEPGAGWYGAG